MSSGLITTEARRVVIKLGTAVVLHEEGGVALDRFNSFVEAIAGLRRERREVLIVSSGAVGLGAERLGITKRPQLLPLKQACAAVGQGRLMSLYSEAFDRLGVNTAQVLLTEEDFSNRRRYLNLRSTITRLLDLGVVPIINENDTVSTAEIETVGAPSHVKINFGDNDKLSALVASKIEADLLIILTDVEGLYTADPGGAADAKLIAVVEEVTPEIEALAEGRAGRVGRGGMKTKIEAARIATRSGCAVIIAGGKIDSVIARIFSGESLGTTFLPSAAIRGRRRWIAFATTVKAAIVVNDGARRALIERKASLLAAGVKEVRGSFERGDAVSILDEQGREFARGIVNYSSEEARKISGHRSDKIDEVIENRNYDALITRDNISFYS
ncbi:MAG TPA: glutamate 5-kinase [Blastocatellia bacterium]|nr:glutamate 5-kinase [Blastocatellia bacterium]